MITENLIAGTLSSEGKATMQSVNPLTQNSLPERFAVATQGEIEKACLEANKAHETYKNKSGKEKSVFLRRIAEEIENLGDVLIERAMSETGLPEGRIIGERGRTCNQLRVFADLVEEGSWVNATMDEALPERKPLPRVDIRKMLIPVGPVAVFTASNFPLAFSTAGGDTASALAAGCPVIVKAHPAHLGTNALVANAIVNAIEKCNIPNGVFSSLNGEIETGQQLVKHPLIKAVGFTGSYSGGRALFDLANSRPEPIPVYAEMGSNNPIFILSEKLRNHGLQMVETIANSVNLGAGQFCTNPGILVMEQSETTEMFLENLTKTFEKLPSDTMLSGGIHSKYLQKKSEFSNSNGVSMLFENISDSWKAGPAIAKVSASTFMDNIHLQEEVFGPFTIAVLCRNRKEMLEVANSLNGQLTGTLMGTNKDFEESKDLIEILIEKVGRLICNGVPTGVEVCPAMHHGGPFPSTSNALFTSVGTDAIKRFTRPVAFQNMPNNLLPSELQNDNSLGIWRTVNGELTKS
ncbi:aldehyde dehydrogenase (NADP(+)) [Flagellimonas meridianipacifica]|uniref:NADP-dependent aldehyde dehydrogenase n=1 Tax=Flagellimonas meridianipacifica TaxID=1080225 RepID=A0A2T0M8V0_9FLAO|nr:aldehyde dehydrogenase (NADP(+)) [Allomuricauda pacifica]PRX53931.1 NADP-dependent aldehyde dehydrogenase [Allomuricauda pacifica]